MNGIKRKVIDLNTHKIYNSTKEMSEDLNINQGTLVTRIRSKYSIIKYKIKYYE